MTVIALTIAGMVVPEDAEVIRTKLLLDARVHVACVEFETATAVVHASPDTEATEIIGIIEGMCGGFTARVAH